MPQNSVQVVAKNVESSHFELAVNELTAILLQKDVKDREIVVISIAGAFRKGKSFMLNFFLKYLNERYIKKRKAGDWLGNDGEHLYGFKWSGGKDRVTAGIHVWPEVFKHDYEDGRKVAIILLDTQGIFDSKTTMKDNTIIFALSTLLSSVQIYNVMQNIAESDLHHLELFSEYGRLAAKKGVTKPFQKLMFLVRDWQYPTDFEYGSDGGLQYLKDYLGNHDDQEQEQRSIRSHIQSCYDNIGCFLMPFPGIKVSNNQNFCGNLKDIEDDFKKLLRSLVPELLAPENLFVKKIGGQSLTCADFLEYFKQYLEAFHSKEMPAPTTLMDANARAHNERVLSKSKEYYTAKIIPLRTILKEDDKKLYAGHSIAKKGAYKLLKEALMGSQEMMRNFENELEIFILTEFQELHNQNSKKFSTAQATAAASAVAGVAALIAAIIGAVLARS